MLVSKTLDIDGEVGIVFRDFYICMAVTDQISDAVHAGVDFVGVQAVQLAIELGHFCFEAFARDEVEGIGVAFRQFGRQIGQVLAPLFFGQT